MTTEELLAKGREGLKAEFDGIISDVKALEGNEAAQGMELFTLVDNKNVNVILEVPANDFDNLAIGSKAVIKIGRSSYKGTVESVDKNWHCQMKKATRQLEQRYILTIRMMKSSLALPARLL